MTTVAPDRELTATRLLKTSAEHSYDPVTDIDWDATPVPGAYYVAPHRTSLYGTPLWEGLTDEQRIELSKHEVASVASVGIWFETILLQMLARYVYERDPRTNHVQYAFTEMADECRHSIMFGRMIASFDAPAYGPGRAAHLLGKFFAATSSPVECFAAALYVEELLDSFQREMARDEALQPMSRQVARLHVVEEARHIKLAREELVRRAHELSPPQRALVRFTLARCVSHATRRLIHPDAYAAAGLDPKEAARVAKNNPHWRATRAWAARKAVAAYQEADLIGGPGMLVWRRLGLLG